MKLIRQGILGLAEKDDHFGGSIAAGDFDDNGADDLAIGVWREGIGSIDNAVLSVSSMDFIILQT